MLFRDDENNTPTVLFADFGQKGVALVFGGLLCKRTDAAERRILNSVILFLGRDDKKFAYRLVSYLLGGGGCSEKVVAELIRITEEINKNPKSCPFPAFQNLLSDPSVSPIDTPDDIPEYNVFVRKLNEKSARESAAHLLGALRIVDSPQNRKNKEERVSFLFVRISSFAPKKRDEFFEKCEDQGYSIFSGIILSKSDWPGPEGFLWQTKKKTLPALMVKRIKSRIEFMIKFVRKKVMLGMVVFGLLLIVFWVFFDQKNKIEDGALEAEARACGALVGNGFSGNPLSVIAVEHIHTRKGR